MSLIDMAWTVVFFSFLIFIFSGCVDQVAAPIEYGNRDNSINSRPINNDDGDIDRKNMEVQDLDNSGTGFLNEKISNQEENLIIEPRHQNNDKIIYHEVQEGETLDSIAENYGQTPSSLAAFNDLPYPCILDESQIIKIKVTNELLNKKNKESDSDLTSHSFPMPVDGTIIAKFGEEGRKGIDIAAHPGLAIKSVTSGTVVYAGNNETFGNLVIIQTNDKKLYLAYAQLKDLILSKGEIVRVDQVIGHVKQHAGDISWFHFAIREGKNAVDPEKYLQQN